MLTRQRPGRMTRVNSFRYTQVFLGHDLLQRSGPLLVPLHDESYFKRVFIDAGALCWPNGLELSPQRLYETCTTSAAA